MKPSFRHLLPVLGLVAALPAARAADEPSSAQKETRKEVHVVVGPDHKVIVNHGGLKEHVTFLGVETGPVSATLSSQLGLAEGSGLVVNHVVPKSPATDVLKQHDILLKLDDQILVEQRQLSVLVRGHKEGDEVTLTYLRGGKQATAKVKLAQHEVMKTSMLPLHDGNIMTLPGMGALREKLGTAFELHTRRSDGEENPEDRENVNRILSMIDGGGVPGIRRLDVQAGPGVRGNRSVSVTVNTGNSHIVLDDDKGSLDLTIKDGHKELVAKNPKGEQVFAGPVDTPEQRKTLPEDVRGRLEKLEDERQFSYHTGADFQGAETKVIRPYGQSIQWRQPAPSRQPAPARLPEFL